MISLLLKVFMPAQLIYLPVFGRIIAFIIAGIILLIYFMITNPSKPKSKQIRANGEKRRYAIFAQIGATWRKRRDAILTTCGIFFLIIGISVSIFWYIQIQHPNEILMHAEKDISQHIHGTLSEGEIKSTKIELETNLLALRKKYAVKDAYEIELNLYSSCEELHKDKPDLPSYSCGSYNFIYPYHIISIPTEESENMLKTPETTSKPRHEIMHAVTTEMLEGNYWNMYLIRLWFKEGLAEYESHRGLEYNRILENGNSSVWLWKNKSRIIDKKVFLYTNEYPADSDAFYATGNELTKYFSYKYGDDKFAEILRLVSQGNNFEYSFSTVMGITTEQLYDNWYELFTLTNGQCEIAYQDFFISYKLTTCKTQQLIKDWLLLLF